MLTRKDISKFTAYAKTLNSRTFLADAANLLKDNLDPDDNAIYKEIEYNMNRLVPKYTELKKQLLDDAAFLFRVDDYDFFGFRIEDSYYVYLVGDARTRAGFEPSALFECVSDGLFNELFCTVGDRTVLDNLPKISVMMIADAVIQKMHQAKEENYTNKELEELSAFMSTFIEEHRNDIITGRNGLPLASSLFLAIREILEGNNH